MRSKSRAKLIALLGVAMTGTVLMVLSAQEPAPTPTPTPEPGVEIQVPAQIPKAAKEMRNPTGGSPESIEDGKQIYSSQCAMCHGSTGNGKGDLAVTLKYRIADLSSAEVQQRRTDGEWFYILSHGHGKMMGEGQRLNEKIRWDLVSYMRSLGP